MRIFEPEQQDFDALASAFRWQVPERFNIGVDVCDKHIGRADQVAIYHEDSTGRSQTLTFGELRALSNRCANVLRGLGVKRGDRVAIVLPQRPETAIAHIAVYKLGAIALPLSILFGPEGLEFRLQDSGAMAVITDREHLPIVDSLRADLPQLRSVLCCDREAGEHSLWSALDKARDEFDPVSTRADDPAMLIYTSGTTGKPKGALNPHRCLLGNLPGFELSHNFFPRSGDRFWTPADWAWTGGLLDGLLPALHYGVPIVGYSGSRFDPEHACALMARHAVRNAFIPPTALKMIMQLPHPKQHRGLVLRSVMSAGEQVAPKLLDWAQRELGVEINEMWGQTECNYLVGNCSAIMEVRPGCMGKPYPGHAVRVVNEEGEPVADGTLGELATRCDDPVMFLGYWQNERATRNKMVAGWFLTGDLAYRDPDGYLHFVGRKDDVISSAGYRIGPGEIEDCLMGHPAIAQVAVVGSPDELRGEIVKAFVVLAEGHEPSPTLATDIQNSVRTRLAAYEFPRAVEFVASLPMTTTGKVRRAELRHLETVRKT